MVPIGSAHGGAVKLLVNLIMAGGSGESGPGPAADHDPRRVGSPANSWPGWQRAGQGCPGSASAAALGDVYSTTLKPAVAAASRRR
jgi:hypothetical protein